MQLSNEDATQWLSLPTETPPTPIKPAVFIVFHIVHLDAHVTTTCVCMTDQRIDGRRTIVSVSNTLTTTPRHANIVVLSGVAVCPIVDVRPQAPVTRRASHPSPTCRPNVRAKPVHAWCERCSATTTTPCSPKHAPNRVVRRRRPLSPLRLLPLLPTRCRAVVVALPRRCVVIDALFVGDCVLSIFVCFCDSFGLRCRLQRGELLKIVDKQRVSRYIFVSFSIIMIPIFFFQKKRFPNVEL